MPDSAELITDDGLFTTRIRRNGQDHLIAGNNLRIDVDGL
jgi:hypothetical protein